MKSVEWSLRAACVVVGVLGAAAAGEPEAMSPERRDEHLASFDHVWETVDRRHWDAEFDHAAWAGARDRLRPVVEGATSDGEARGAMSELLRSLGESHYGIIPLESYEILTPEEDDPEEARERGPGDTGITVRLRDDEFLVVRVRPGSTGAAAGVEPGWFVERIGEVATAEILEAARASAGVERVETICALAAQRRIDGRAGQTVALACRTPGGEQRTVEIERAPEPGEVARLGNLPETRVFMDARTLDGGVGYFTLNVFLDPPRVMPAFEKFVRDHADAPGIVIDMRGNLGGVIAMSMGMGGWFVEEPNLYLGTMQMPGAELRLVLNPRQVTYKGPVAVLVDEVSISNAELLAAGLKDIGRARVFGARSAGLLLPSVVEKLPNGDGFQYAIAGYRSASGTSPEGVGVAPDVEVLETPASVAGGADPVLRAALEWIQGGG